MTRDAHVVYTLLPEALEKWTLRWFEIVLPTLADIVCEIDRRFLDIVRGRSPGDEGRVARVSLIEEGVNRDRRLKHHGQEQGPGRREGRETKT